MGLDEMLAAPFTAAAAARSGLRRGELERLCRTGVVRRVLHGVYASSHLDDDLAARAAAVALVLPPGGVVCRRSAAWLRGVDLRTPGEAVLPVEALVPPSVTPPRRPGLISHQSRLPDDDVDIVGGIPATTGLRTASDLARFRPRVEAVVAIDALVRARLCTLDALAALAPELRGRRGVRQLIAVLEVSDPRAESQMETRIRLVIIDNGLPAPEVQFEVRDRCGSLIARLDLAYPYRRLGLEYDGLIAHTELQAFRRDRERQNELLATGWTLLRFVARDVLSRPQYIVRRVEGLLAA